VTETIVVAAILFAYALALAVVYWGFFRGWFDIKVVRVLSPYVVELTGGRTLTFGARHYLERGDRVSMVINGRPI